MSPSIPRMPAHPIFGNLPEIRQDRLGFFLRVCERCGGIGEYRRMFRSIILLTDPAYIQTVLVDQAAIVGVARQTQRFLRPILGDGLLTSDDATHACQRERTAPVFAYERTTSVTSDILVQVDRFQRTLVDGMSVDMFPAMQRLALAIMGRTLFGVDIHDGDDEIGTLLTTVIDLLNRVTQSQLPLPLTLPIPRNRRFMRAVAQLNDVLYRLIAQRIQADRSQGDILSLLLRNQAGDAPLSPTQVRDEVLTIFLAGYETLAAALTWMWYLLGQHPAVYDQLRHEVDQMLGGQPPTVAALSAMPILRQVIREALRLYPPIHLISRQVGATPIDLAGGYQLPAGAYCLMSIYALHRQAAYFPEPDRFLPARWTPTFEQQLPRYAYIPFGVGARSCVGEHVAMSSIQLGLVTLLQSVIFDSSGPVVPKGLLTLRPSDPIMMRVRRR